MSGNDTFTVFLTNCDGADTSTVFTDSSVGGSTHVITANGNAQVSTTDPKFGTGALLLDGTTDYLSTPASTDFEYGTGDFAVDVQIKPDTLSGDRMIYRHFENSDNKISFFQRDQTLRLNIETANVVLLNVGTANILSSGVWQHVGFARNGNNFYIIHDGTSYSVGSSVLSTPTYTANLNLGSSVTDSHFDGRFDEYRISKGTSRGYESNYTAPTEAYSTDAYTIRQRYSTDSQKEVIRERYSNELKSVIRERYSVTSQKETIRERYQDIFNSTIRQIFSGLGEKRYDIDLLDSTGTVIDSETYLASVSMPIVDVFPSTTLTGPDTYSIHCKSNEYLPNNSITEDTYITFSVDGAGVLQPQFPNAPNTLISIAKEGASAEIRWKYNTFEHEIAPDEFNVYHNSGAGPIDYGTSQGTVVYVSGQFQYSITLSGLTDGLTYSFGVRSKSGANEEQNTNTTSALIDGTAPDPVPFTFEFK